jgi:hypothetical protein
MGRPVVFIGPRQRPLFANEWIEAFGIDLVPLPANEVVLFEKMAVPEPAWRLNAWVAPEIRRIHLHAREQMTIPPVPTSETLWLSRGRLGLSRTACDEYLLEWLVRDHVRCVSPETLNLANQVGIVENADVATGIVGSAFHTLLLAKSPPRCLFLCPATVASAYVAQTQLTGCESTFVQVLEPLPLAARERFRFPAGYRVMIPEALEALSSSVPKLYKSSTVKAILRQREKRASLGLPRRRTGLLEAITLVAHSPYSAGSRIALGELFEASGDIECAAEQFLAAADFSGHRGHVFEAVRLLECIDRDDLAQEAMQRQSPKAGNPR